MALLSRAEPRLRYLAKSLEKQLQRRGRACPNCGCPRSSLVARKHLVTELRRCVTCALMFRAPTTTAEESASFYQSRYQQGFTTTMPDDASLGALLREGFRGSAKDFTPYLQVLAALGVAPGARLFDFGCSWGYGSWQFARAGYDTQAYEISEPRRSFARARLGVDTVEHLDEARRPFDVFFSAHVLEHVPSVSAVIAGARRLLRPGGLFVAFTPNGSRPHRSANRAWSKAWGLVHPNLLDDGFYAVAFPTGPLWLGSDPYDHAALSRWATATQGPAARHTRSLAGGELLCVARL